MLPDAEADCDTKLTVIEAQRCWGEWGTWTELEVWYWFHGEPRPRRFALSVDGRPQLRLGDLVRRDPNDSAWLLWWDHHGKFVRRLLVISDVDELPTL